MNKLRLSALAVVVAVLALPAYASAGSTTLKAHLMLGQVTPATDNDGNLVTLVNGIVEITNVGTDPTEGLVVSSEVSLPTMRTGYQFGDSTDLLYAPIIQSGETRCYGLGGYAPYVPNTSYVLKAHISATNSRVSEWTLTEGGYFDEETGLAGHIVAPGWIDCP